MKEEKKLSYEVQVKLDQTEFADAGVQVAAEEVFFVKKILIKKSKFSFQFFDENLLTEILEKIIRTAVDEIAAEIEKEQKFVKTTDAFTTMSRPPTAHSTPESDFMFDSLSLNWNETSDEEIEITEGLEDLEGLEGLEGFGENSKNLADLAEIRDSSKKFVTTLIDNCSLYLELEEMTAFDGMTS